ncbi:response regulator transcription factor [Actinocatenispora thailandica]|nr:LuxR C-terminal-related transcriptional regulator [Actinocatenispora thailandica]
MRILLVGKYKLTRDGLRFGLAGRRAELEVVAEASSLPEAVAECGGSVPEAVVIEYALVAEGLSAGAAPDDAPQVRPDDARLDQLTPRERDVFRLLGRGLSNAAIARALSITERTVKSYVGRVLAKLGLESRLQAGIAAYAHHIGAGSVRLPLPPA